MTTSPVVARLGLKRRQLTPDQRESLSKHGRAVAATLHMLLRGVKMYDADNDLFNEPLATLRSAINSVVADEREFNLQAVGTVLALNGLVIPVDFAALEALRGLTSALKAAGLGGFILRAPVEVTELKQFLRLFSSSITDAEREVIRGTIAIKVSTYVEIQTELDRVADDEVNRTRGVDRDKYALTVYARALAFLRQLEGAELPSLAPSVRIVVDFVDLARSGSKQVLGTAGGDDEAPLYHAVNSCVLALLIGIDLDLSRDQLLDLGRAALFLSIPPDEKTQAPVALFRARPLDITLVSALVIASESRAPSTQSTAIAARILRVAASFDVLTQTRPSGPQTTASDALDLMLDDVTLDAALVTLLARLLAKHDIAKMIPAPKPA